MSTNLIPSDQIQNISRSSQLFAMSVVLNSFYLLFLKFNFVRKSHFFFSFLKLKSRFQKPHYKPFKYCFNISQHVFPSIDTIVSESKHVYFTAYSNVITLRALRRYDLKYLCLDISSCTLPHLLVAPDYWYCMLNIDL